MNNLLSASESFSWMHDNFSQVIDYVASAWLDSAMTNLAATTKALCHKKVGVSISIFKTSKHSSFMVAGAVMDGPFTFEQWAFDEPINIPVGGIKPERGVENFKLIKPEGFRWRKRNYVKYSGARLTSKQLKGKGFLTVALAQTFTQSRLDELGSSLASVVAASIAAKLRNRVATGAWA
jgi:hypothetical protein